MAIAKVDSAFERLSNPEAAQYLGVSVHTLDSWRCIKKPFIPYLKVGARVFYRKADLDAFLAANTVEG
ncbi:helix-turn-helix domain-containing protein [Pseudogulbenkiania subflava]|uniref:DNA binding domain-containing protein, excisionase family n=1 Tax=Pseudogulbenkiania subflava DSM 22618 TaxID=1123014 RepID=A0A1Y6C9S7_9NEIS|nr:helix-turn-helix domain-containing protein [Pseudogulbenkiania subflava]SMF53435.1 DNA binding domain-containing protein, excisionase family [Pseudogulbenkiania subflava DSM 22618]